MWVLRAENVKYEIIGQHVFFFFARRPCTTLASPEAAGTAESPTLKTFRGKKKLRITLFIYKVSVPRFQRKVVRPLTSDYYGGFELILSILSRNNEKKRRENTPNLIPRQHHLPYNNSHYQLLPSSPVVRGRCETSVTLSLFCEHELNRFWQE